LNIVVLLILDGMVLGGPADAKSVTDLGDGHLAPLATIGLANRIGQRLIRTRLLTSLLVGARQGRVGVLVDLLVVTVGVGRVEGAKGLAEREATGVTVALSGAISPVLALLARDIETTLLELPVNAVSPGVSISLLGSGGEKSQSGNGDKGEGRLENHFVNVRVCVF